MRDIAPCERGPAEDLGNAGHGKLGRLGTGAGNVFRESREPRSIVGYLFIFLFTFIHIHAHIHTYIHAYIHTSIHACLPACASLWMRLYIHIYTYTHIHIADIARLLEKIFRCMLALFYIGQYAMIASVQDTHICVNTHVHVHTHIYIHTSMHIHIHIHIHIYPLRPVYVSAVRFQTDLKHKTIG